MARGIKKAVLKAPPEKVWQYIIDPDKLQKWRTDILELKLPGEPLKVGDRYEIRKKEGKRIFAYVCTVKALEEGKRFSFTAEGVHGRVEGEYRMNKTEDGTEIEIDEEIIPRGFMGKIIDIFILPRLVDTAVNRLVHNMQAVIDGTGQVKSS